MKNKFNLQQKIYAYHKDEFDNWVTELECRHNQHIRHNPPFINRPWVMTLQSRNEKIGQYLNCVKCDTNEKVDF